MPGRYWYVVAALVWLGGFLAAGLFLWGQLTGLEAALMRVTVPGSTVLDLAETGSYTIFHEPRGVIDGQIYAAENISGLRVGLRSEASGENVPLNRAAGSRYSVGGHSGYSLLSFDLAAPGRYRLSSSYDNGRSEPRTVLALGQGFASRLVMLILGAVGMALGGGGIGVAIAVVTFVKRRRARRAAAASSASSAAA